MKKICSRLLALLRFAPRPDPLDLIVRLFALDPFRRESRIDKVEDSK
jgi:hypothetical protein